MTDEFDKTFKPETGEKKIPPSRDCFTNEECNTHQTEPSFENHISHLIDFAGIPMFTLNPDGNLLMANSAWLSLHQFVNPADVLDKPFIDIILDLEPSSAVQGYRDAISCLGPSQFKTSIRHAGKFLTYTVTIMPRRMNDTTIEMTGILCAAISAQYNLPPDSLSSMIGDALVHIADDQNVVPICASCKRVRDNEGYWNQLERIISEATPIDFSHSICPDCSRRLYPDLFEQQDTNDDT